jgi:hypothetical protein
LHEAAVWLLHAWRFRGIRLIRSGESVGILFADVPWIYNSCHDREHKFTPRATLFFKP